MLQFDLFIVAAACGCGTPACVADTKASALTAVADYLALADTFVSIIDNCNAQRNLIAIYDDDGSGIGYLCSN